MLSFAGMLLAPFSPEKKTKRVIVPPKSGPVIKAKSQGRYRLIMEGKSLTTGEIAEMRGISHVGCLNALYKMEKDGVVVRLGLKERKGRGKLTILWGWK